MQGLTEEKDTNPAALISCRYLAAGLLRFQFLSTHDNVAHVWQRQLLNLSFQKAHRPASECWLCKLTHYCQHLGACMQVYFCSGNSSSRPALPWLHGDLVKKQEKNPQDVFKNMFAQGISHTVKDFHRGGYRANPFNTDCLQSREVSRQWECPLNGKWEQ